MGNVILITCVTIILFHYRLPVLRHDHSITTQLQLYYILDIGGSISCSLCLTLTGTSSCLCMTWAGQVARTGEKKITCWVSAGKPQQKKPLEDLGKDKRIWLGGYGLH
jgi:hypothetical protein